MKIKMYTKKEIDAMLKKYDSVGVVMKYDEDLDNYLIRNPKPDKEKRVSMDTIFTGAGILVGLIKTCAMIAYRK